MGPTTQPRDEDVERAWHDNKLAQILYHDFESTTYDEKWSIDFDQRCIDYARDRFVAVVGSDDEAAWPYRRVLELGSGTGFFSINLRLAGVVDSVHLSDVSPGMLEVATRNAAAAGLEMEGSVADAEALPFPDDSFDLVIGHAVIHHIPDVEKALTEVIRVLRPGGRFVFAGEPSTIGNWYARRLGHATWIAATTVTRLPRLREKYALPAEDVEASSKAHLLESVVDLHTFTPDYLSRMALRAGAVDVRTASEELTAAFVGWPVRTIEAAVRPGALGWGWAKFAYGSWLRLSALDRRLSTVVPAAWYYNVGVTGVKPPTAG